MAITVAFRAFRANKKPSSGSNDVKVRSGGVRRVRFSGHVFTPTASTSSEPNDGSCPHYRQDSRLDQVAYNSDMQRVTCDACGRVVPAHAHYVVRIDVFADPEMPQTSSEELAEMDFDRA